MRLACVCLFYPCEELVNRHPGAQRLYYVLSRELLDLLAARRFRDEVDVSGAHDILRYYVSAAVSVDEQRGLLRVDEIHYRLRDGSRSSADCDAVLYVVPK